VCSERKNIDPDNPTLPKDDHLPIIYRRSESQWSIQLKMRRTAYLTLILVLVNVPHPSELFERVRCIPVQFQLIEIEQSRPCDLPLVRHKLQWELPRILFERLMGSPKCHGLFIFCGVPEQAERDLVEDDEHTERDERVLNNGVHHERCREPCSGLRDCYLGMPAALSAGKGRR
jgi:hypothetical protein